MKKLLAILLALVSGRANADSAKLGSDFDSIRQMLFASQTLKEQVRQMHLDGKPGPFQSVADAAKLVEEGKKAEAIAVLRGVLDIPKLETRITLWVWSALRELGEKPDSKYACEVLGVILEMPSGGAYDTIAAYMDGSARYLNFSDAAIFWDAEDPKIKALCRRFVESTIPAISRAAPRSSLMLPRSGTQVTLLTRSGIYTIANAPDSVVGAGGALMLELIRRAKEKKG
jgi:hypothetical protein